MDQRSRDRAEGTARRSSVPFSLWSAFVLAGAALLALLLGLDTLSNPVAAAETVGTSGRDGSPGLQGGGWKRKREQPALVRLTHDGDSTPWTWTPDGQGLLVRRPGQIVDRQQLYELWELSTGDRGRREDTRLAENAIYPAANGTRVAYLRYVDRDRWEAVVTDRATGESAELGAAQWSVPPRWVEGEVLYLDPSGRWATLAGPNRPPSLEALSTGQDRAQPSHDGRYVATTDGRQLQVLGPEGTVTVARADQIWGFSWSPVGARLAYVRSDGGPMPELWVWDAGAGGVGGRSTALARGELESFGTPAWSPDGRTLAFVRRPTGNGGNATGDIWLVRADEGEGDSLRPLARTPGDERAPRWSPDGRRLAFAMDGDIWVVDPWTGDRSAPHLQALMATSGTVPLEPALPGMAPDHSAVAPLGLTAPLTIWVMHDAAGNTCRSVPDGQIDALPFEQYVKQVVPNEVPALWPGEVLKTQAVAARTYAWRKTLDRPHSAYSYTVKDSTDDQYMCDETNDRTNAAVETTGGQYISYGGGVIYAFFCAEAGDPTNYYMQFPGLAYLRSVNDPVSFGRERHGHSWGMSQRGTYRWVTQHGWDYQQALGHYYTRATVEPSSAATQPLASLIHPWSNHYVTTDRAYLAASAGSPASSIHDTGIVTVAFSVRLTDTWTSVFTDTEASDGWAYVWPAPLVPETTTPTLGLRATAYDSLGQRVESGVSRVGLNRTPPIGMLSLSPTETVTSTETTTLTLTLYVTATDPSPVEGPIRMSLDDEDWTWEDHALYRTAGETVADSAAGDGSAWHIGAGTPGLLYGPYTDGLPTGRPYRAYFRLKAPAEALTSPLELARLDVVRDGGSELLGVRYLRGTDFGTGEAYQEFAVEFDYAEEGGELEFRTHSYGTSDLWVDRVSVTSYPADLPLQADGPFLTSWTLPAREGPARIRARFVDGAENASPEVALMVTVTDRSPPGGWRQFRCSGRTCTVQVRDTIAGLDTKSAAYRAAVGSDPSWGDWLPATCTGVDGSHDWETLTITDPAISATASSNSIQFRVYDLAAVPNEARSLVYTLYRVYLPLVMRSGG